MTDMSQVIIPKSDQINAEDFIAGPRTYTIEGVAITPGTEQPVQIKLVDEPRVWRPCKSMSRVLVAAWGPDAKVYTGRAVTLYRDPKVKWGGMEVGGIRVSHLSHIERDMLIQLTATKGKRAPHVVKPLVAEVREIKPAEDGAAKWTAAMIAKVRACGSEDDLAALSDGQAARLAELKTKRPELHQQITDAIAAHTESLKPGRTDADHGDQFDGAEEWAE